MRLDIVYQIWAYSPPGFHWFALGHKRTGYWQDVPVELDGLIPLDLLVADQEPYPKDVYFAPLSYKEKMRTNDAANKAGVLYADLDEVAPTSISPQPSIAWCTSKGMFQGVWLLDHPIAQDLFVDLNKRLTYAVGADRGGWHGSKVLRVPGSINWKRGGDEGELLWDNSQTFQVEDFAGLPPVSGATEHRGDHPEPKPRGVWKLAVQRAWDQWPPSVRSAMAADPRDRSLHIVRTINLLKGLLWPDDEIFHLIWWAKFNKFRTDSERPEVLWNEITR